MSLSRKLYRAGRIAGDIEAAQRGRLIERLSRRALYRVVMKALRKVLP